MFNINLAVTVNLENLCTSPFPFDRNLKSGTKKTAAHKSDPVAYFFIYF